LAELVNPAVNGLDPDMAIDVFRESEPDMHIVARREFVDISMISNGAAYRTRTCDPRITNAMLYQLS
jgi:hypothetical protein